MTKFIRSQFWDHLNTLLGYWGLNKLDIFIGDESATSLIHWGPLVRLSPFLMLIMHWNFLGIATYITRTVLSMAGFEAILDTILC